MPSSAPALKTEEGKRRSAQNAVRHGLTAETIIPTIEDAEDYQSFEEAVAASFEPENAVERELILRLASLLWRLRRATAIETGLLQMGDGGTQSPLYQPGSHAQPKTKVVRLHGVMADTSTPDLATPSCSKNEDLRQFAAIEPPSLAYCFIRLGSLEGAFDRISRYEVQLWRQARQILLALDQLHHRRRTACSPHSRGRWNRMPAFTSD